MCVCTRAHCQRVCGGVRGWAGGGGEEGGSIAVCGSVHVHSHPLRVFCVYGCGGGGGGVRAVSTCVTPTLTGTEEEEGWVCVGVCVCVGGGGGRCGHCVARVCRE